MNSRPRTDSSAVLRGGALAGALFGAIEARWALPAVEMPLLSSSEWWMTWFSSVALGASCGLLVGLLVRLLSLGRAPTRNAGVAIGLSFSLPLFAALFLRLRPHFGPDGRSTTLLIAGGVGVVFFLLPIFLDPRERRRWLLMPGLLLVALATLSGLVLSFRQPAPWSGKETRPPSALLLTVDTTRADHLPPNAAFLDENGFFWDLQRNAVHFDDIIAPLPLTGPSHASLLTGVLPLVHGAMDNGWKIRPEQQTLAAELQQAGYATGAVLSAAVLHRDLCGLEKGFDEYDDSFRPADPLRRIVFVAALERMIGYLQGNAQGLSHQRRARETVDIGIRFLRQHRDRPFFLWLHFYDPHAPYEPLSALPAREDLPVLEGEPEDVSYWEKRRAYAAEIRDLDYELRRLAPEMERLGVLDSTVQVLVSDHGESFGTHGRDYVFDHGAYLFDDVLLLSAWWRDTGSGGAATSPECYWINELGTALRSRLLGKAARGGSPDPAYAAGQRWANSTVADDTLWFAYRRPERKLLVGRALNGSLVYEAYDLQRDPQEQRQLLVDRLPPSLCAAESLGMTPIDEWIEDERMLMREAETVLEALAEDAPELSDEARERLKSLGYIR